MTKRRREENMREGLRRAHEALVSVERTLAVGHYVLADLEPGTEDHAMMTSVVSRLTHDRNLARERWEAAENDLVRILRRAEDERDDPPEVSDGE